MYPQKILFSHDKISLTQFTVSPSLSICTFPCSLYTKCIIQIGVAQLTDSSKRCHVVTLSPSLSPQGAISDQERKKLKRKGDRYTMQTSLIVATLKRMLPVGLNICAPGDQELIALAKNRFTQVVRPLLSG